MSAAQPPRNFPLLFPPLDIRPGGDEPRVVSNAFTHAPRSHTLSQQKVIKSRMQTCKLLLAAAAVFSPDVCTCRPAGARSSS